MHRDRTQEDTTHTVAHLLNTRQTDGHSNVQQEQKYSWKHAMPHLVTHPSAAIVGVAEQCVQREVLMVRDKVDHKEHRVLRPVHQCTLPALASLPVRRRRCAAALTRGHACGSRRRGSVRCAGVPRAAERDESGQHAVTVRLHGLGGGKAEDGHVLCEGGHTRGVVWVQRRDSLGQLGAELGAEDAPDLQAL